jgi:hypothetical protein
MKLVLPVLLALSLVLSASACGRKADPAKVNAFIAAVEKDAAYMRSTSDAVCHGGAEPGLGMKEILGKSEENGKAVRQAFDDLMASEPPSGVADQAKEVLKAGAMVKTMSAGVIASCDANSADDENPEAKKRMDAQVSKLDGAIIGLRAEL